MVRTRMQLYGIAIYFIYHKQYISSHPIDIGKVTTAGKNQLNGLVFKSDSMMLHFSVCSLSYLYIVSCLCKWLKLIY